MPELLADRVSLDIAGSRLLHDLSLKLASPGISFVMGANGAGKSLLLRVLHGLICPTAGQLRVDGQPIDDTIRRRQAMVFQKPVLLRRSVLANLDFVLKARRMKDRDRLETWLERLDLAGRRHQAARSLSGGEQQRLALARALLLEPEILFLDEATANLDPVSLLLIESVIAEVGHANTRVVMVSHDIAQARRLADEVLFLHHGKLLEQSASERFFDQPASTEAAGFLQGRIVL